MITDCDGFAIDSTTGLFIFYDILNPMVTSVLPLGHVQDLEIYIRPGFDMDAGKTGGIAKLEENDPVSWLTISPLS